MTQTNPIPISAVVITRNEESNLPRCLRSLSFCDEIVVLDSGSTDRTREIASGVGARVSERPFTRYGEQKSHAASLASHDWVFSLDADEEVTPELAAEIIALIQNPELKGIWIRSRLVFLGRVFRFGRESRVRVLRIFRRSAGDFDRAAVHEKVLLQSGARTVTTRHHIHHFSYPDLAHYFQKMNRYTTLGAENLAGKTGLVRASLHLLLTPFKFLQFYLQHLNILNGLEGLAWSLLSTLAYLLKFTKVIRIRSRG